MMIRFTKMQAFGNDYVYIDAIHQQLPNLSHLAIYLSDRHFAIGSDGIVLICASDTADFRMRMFNPDGTEGEMCGNALRSVGKYVYDHKMTRKKNLLIETLGGIKRLKLFVEDGLVYNIMADIGIPVLSTSYIPVNVDTEEFIEQPVRVLDKEFLVTAVSWGNPHMVTFLTEEDCQSDLKDFDVETYGRALEYKTDLFPNKTNVTFARIINPNYIRIREWERGTGETIGCGTGCCTAVVAAVLTGRCERHITVEQIGGPLEIEWNPETNHMFMTGPSHTMFEAEIDVSHITTEEEDYDIRTVTSRNGIPVPEGQYGYSY